MNVLTQRIGPLPAWVWAAVAAGGVWFFLLRGKPSTSSAGATQGNALNSGYSLGYAQGVQAAGPPSAPGPQTPPGSRAVVTSTQSGSAGTGLRQGPSFDAPGGQRVPIGTELQVDPQPVYTADKQNWFYKILDGAYKGLWVWGQDVQIQNAVGGPARKHAVGSRRAAPLWHDAHPLVGGPVKYPHFVRAVGGPGNHQREIHRVAQAAGVHPARIAMLNPVPSGMIRVA